MGELSSAHNTYYNFYKYVVKEDLEAITSNSHPDLGETPRTETAIVARKRKNGNPKRNPKKKCKERLSIYDVTQLIQSRCIKSRLELVCLAVQQNKEGKSCSAEFIAKRGGKAVEEALALGQEFSEAEEKFARAKKPRIELLSEAYNGFCAADCNRLGHRCSTK